MRVAFVQTLMKSATGVFENYLVTYSSGIKYSKNSVFNAGKFKLYIERIDFWPSRQKNFIKKQQNIDALLFLFDCALIQEKTSIMY